MSVAIAEQNGVEAVLPPNVYEFDGVVVRLLEPAKVKATHEAHNERLMRLIEDKSGSARAKAAAVSADMRSSEIAELKQGQRSQMTVNETILTRLAEMAAKIDGLGKGEAKAAKSDTK